MDTTIVNELAATKARIIIINNLDWEAASKELFKGEHGKPVYPSPVKGGRFKDSQMLRQVQIPFTHYTLLMLTQKSVGEKPVIKNIAYRRGIIQPPST